MESEVLFGADMGTLPRGMGDRPILSLNDLFWSEETAGLLRLCGIPEERLDARASEFERFEAFCEALPLLAGHPYPLLVKDAVKALFGEELPLSRAEAREVWLAAADRLARLSLHVRDLLPEKGARLLSGEKEPPVLPGVLPVLDSRCMEQTSAATLAAWEEEILSVLAAYRARGADTVFASLGAGYRFSAPDPYHVGEALKRRSRGEEERSLLTGQLLRILSAACLRDGMRLCLSIESATGDTMALLGYLRRTVGLPPLLWTTTSREIQDAMLALAREPGGQGMEWMLKLSHTPTEQGLREAMAEAGARYPRGRLRLLSLSDLRLSRFVRERTLRCLEMA